MINPWQIYRLGTFLGLVLVIIVAFVSYRIAGIRGIDLALLILFFSILLFIIYWVIKIIILFFKSK